MGPAHASDHQPSAGIDNPADAAPSAGFLNTTYIDWDSGGGPGTFPVDADATREMIGFYMRSTSGIISILPMKATGNATIDLCFIGDYIEFRKSTHGPMVMDSFALSAAVSAALTIIIINRQGY